MGQTPTKNEGRKPKNKGLIVWLTPRVTLIGSVVTFLSDVFDIGLAPVLNKGLQFYHSILDVFIIIPVSFVSPWTVPEWFPHALIVWTVSYFISNQSAREITGESIVGLNVKLGSVLANEESFLENPVLNALRFSIRLHWLRWQNAVTPREKAAASVNILLSLASDLVVLPFLLTATPLMVLTTRLDVPKPIGRLLLFPFIAVALVGGVVGILTTIFLFPIRFVSNQALAPNSKYSTASRKSLLNLLYILLAVYSVNWGIVNDFAGWYSLLLDTISPSVLPPYNCSTNFVVFYEPVEVLRWQESDIRMRMC